jgi:hypothetical protein
MRSVIDFIGLVWFGWFGWFGLKGLPLPARHDRIVMGRVGESSPVTQQMRNSSAKGIRKYFDPRDSSAGGSRTAWEPGVRSGQLPDFSSGFGNSMCSGVRIGLSLVLVRGSG